MPISCKLIITTRSLEICQMMSCHEKIKLEPLVEKESWNLFVQKLGNYVTVSWEVKEVAKSVVRECAGLPLGLVTLARSMRWVDDVREWRSVLEQLKQSIIVPDDTVFKVLNLSYEQLKDPVLQECFLYCAFFPEDWLISREELIEYLIGEDIIKDLNSRQSQFDRGHIMLTKLENDCLLEGYPNFYVPSVKMHKWVRDMAINKMRGNPKAMVQAGKGLKEVPNVIEWSKDLVRVSLMENDIKEIPWGHSPSCPNLLTLLLCQNRHLELIADSFFLEFCGLKILDLSDTAIRVLPDSVSNLVSLTSLLLRFCKQLWHIPSLAALKTLKKLDLRGCKTVEVVPGGLECLYNLQYLDMHGTQIEDMPNGLLSNLSHLQYLILPRSIAVQVKSGCLLNVEHLECRFPKPLHFCSMMMDFHQRPLLSIFRLLIGEFNCDEGDIFDELDMRSKSIVYYRCNNIGKDGDFVGIPVDLDLLVISRCHTFRSLDNAFVPDGAGAVRIERCEGLEYLISSSHFSSAIFDHIMDLHLEDLNNLRHLISREGAPSFRPGGVFSCLKCFSIYNCPSITSLFPNELLPNFQNLEQITVESCEKIEQIIGEESDSNSHTEFISLPKLKILKFRNLPELKSICSKKLACDPMVTINIEKCPKHTFSFIGNNAFNKEKEHETVEDLVREVSGRDDNWVCVQDHDTVEDLGRIDSMQVTEVSGKDDSWDCGENMRAYIGKAATHHSSEDLINCRRLNNCVSNKLDFELTDPITGSKGELLGQLSEKLNDQLWDACPLRSPSLNFRAEILVVLSLTHNNDVQFWNGKQDLVNVKQIDLSYSSLIILPDLSKASKLRSLDLQSCNNLVNVSSIQFLIKLEYLNLSGCTSLRSLPSMMALKLLSSLHLSGCSKIRRLPILIGCLSGLTVLDIRNCKSLQNLPISTSRLKSIQTLNISGCSMLMKRVSRSGTEEIPQSAMASSLFQSESINPGSHISSNTSSDDIPVFSPQNNGIECASGSPVEVMRSKVKVLEDPLSATVASPLGRTEGIEEFLQEKSSESLNQLVAQHCQKRCLESFMGGSSNKADFEETPSVRRKISSESEHLSSSTTKEKESTELECGIKPSSVFLEPPLARNETRLSKVLVQTSPSKNLQSEKQENSAKETVLTLPLAFKRSNKCDALVSSGFSQQKKALESYMDMPVEAIYEADAYEDIGRILDAMIQQTSDLHKRTNLEDIMSFLEEFNENIPDTMILLKSSLTHRTLLQLKLTCLDVSLLEGQEQCSSLEAELATISEEEAKLEAEIQLLMAKKEEQSKECQTNS